MKFRSPLFAALLLAVPLAAQGQQAKQSKAKAKAPAMRPPDAVTAQDISEKSAALRAALAAVRGRRADDIVAEVEVYAKAAEWVARHQEYFNDTARWIPGVLDDGLKRARQAATADAPPWRAVVGTSVVRAYRSRVDGSVQPYAVTAPAGYGQDPKAEWRLDVVLHGRDATLTEVKFLHQFRARPAGKDQQFVQLDIYGRGNNAYRWAGETDVFEALEAFLTAEGKGGRAKIDARRIVLRGFSMGGAGTWHIGLHHPSRWAVIGPGAGFSATHGYVRNLPRDLPDHVERCLRIYDAVEYADNAATVPVVAYAGADDPQIQAARNVEARLKPLGIPMTLLVAPNTEHRMPPEWAANAEAEYTKHAGPGKGRVADPTSIRFVTHTLKYNRCDWVELLGLQRHYDKASVEAVRNDQGIQVKTSNVRRLRLGRPEKPGQRLRVEINSQPLELETSGPEGALTWAEAELIDGKWSGRSGGEGQRPIEKTPGRQGPIDDAFSGPFVCVRGTGRPWHEATVKYADEELQRFQRNWDKHLRGQLPLKDDTAITAEDIRDRHLILFGDPSSNAQIAKVLPRLPLTWTKEQVGLGAASGDAAGHMPVLIYPNPLNPAKYVVLNSGHTFGAKDFEGTNALLYPRLGDYALLRLGPTDMSGAEVVRAGLFDEFWQLPK